MIQIWGGENIEFSLRVWTCGGEMEIVPCSKVGHIYKQRNVYSYPEGRHKTNVCNNRRVADAWLDDFKQVWGEGIGAKVFCKKPEKPCSKKSNNVKKS